MPYKSLAQQRKFHALAKAGKIKRSVVAEWDDESEGLDLPDHLQPRPFKPPKKPRNPWQTPKFERRP